MNVPSLHPSFRRVKAFADDEIAPAARRRVAEHLAECARCRDTVSSLRALREAAREETDWAVPEGAWERILARRAEGERVILPDPTTSAPALGGRLLASPLARAAVLLLTVAGIGSATLLSPPVRSWWTGPREPVATIATPRTAPRPAGGTVHSPDQGTTGMLVAPASGQVRVIIEAPDPALRIRVRLVDGGSAGVRASGAAAGATFRSGRGRVVIVQPGAGELRVDLPKELRTAEVIVDSSVFLRTRGAHIDVLAPRAETVGREVILPARR